MTVDKQYIERQFHLFNNRMFGSRLPLPNIELSDSGRFLGKCTALAHTTAGGHTEYSRFTLRINARADLPQQTLDDVIIHEMIHYFIFYHNLNDTSAHGEIFRAVMNSINAAHGRHISISHKCQSAQERESMVSQKRSWKVIAAISMADGGKAVKVLPRTKETVVRYRRSMLLSPSVKSVELYFSDNPFFNRYPKSGTMRIHMIDGEILSANLAGARRITDGEIS